MTFKEQYEAARAANTLENKEPNFIKLENEGDTLIGRLLGYDEVQSAQGEGKFNMYVFQTDDGLVKTKFGAATDKMIAKYLEIGKVYFMQFLGQQELPNHTKVNRFRIEGVPEYTGPTTTVGEQAEAKKKHK